MIIGIISDTHNDMEMTRRAVDVFRERKVDMVIHAGDITSPKMLQLFRGLNPRFVLGNEDLDVDFLNEEAARLGFSPIGTLCRLEADGKRIIVFHGNDVPLFRESVASREYDYIIKGHTHFFENYISNRTRIINPGALYRSDDYSVAILDTERDNVEIVTIKGVR